jgi:hypothetical protein
MLQEDWEEGEPLGAARVVILFSSSACMSAMPWFCCGLSVKQPIWAFSLGLVACMRSLRRSACSVCRVCLHLRSLRSLQFLACLQPLLQTHALLVLPFTTSSTALAMKAALRGDVLHALLRLHSCVPDLPCVCLVWLPMQCRSAARA